MIQPNGQLKQLIFEITVCDKTMSAKLEISQAVSIDDKQVFNEFVHFIP